MTLSGYFMLKSVFGQQGCRALSFALARLSGFSLTVRLCHPKSSVTFSILTSKVVILRKYCNFTAE